ncbi:MAG: hypothetical protein U0359_09890 [Byssovorax sp.]
MKNPRFADNQTFSLAAKPPFYFEGMTTRVFPLRASLFQQQRFADAYFNQVVPREVGRFRAFMPYVLLMIMDYGKMAAAATNLGWVSQREIMFTVPLLWYRVIDGRWVFHDWATVTPFIYVDDELSMTLGRTAYGWPKTLAWLAPGLNEWIEDPRAEPRAAAVSTMVFPEVYAGKRQQPREFLEIHESASLSPLAFPQDPQGPFMPWSVLANLARSGAGLIGDGIDLMSGLGLLRQQRGISPRNFQRMADRAAELADLYAMQTAINTINLKQFRSSEHPSQYCYQALTNAQMKLTYFKRGGMMGDVHLLAGDASGGYSLDIHRWSSLPIIETLGIKVEREWQGDGARVSRVRPVMPFWYEVNMDYDVGRTECWRTREVDWLDRRGRSIARKRGVPRDITFNTALGASGQAVAGPFRFPSTTIRVLPLLAYRRKLQEFLDGYLNRPLSSAGLRFTVWSDARSELSYVYVLAINYEEMSSATNNIGWWAERELFFAVPVKVERRRDDGGYELCTVGLVPVFSYANSTTAAIARSEVIGIATTKAEIESPPEVWMTDRGPARDKLRTLLRVSSEVLPVIGEGQKTQTQVILDVQEGEVLSSYDDPRWRSIGEDWGRMLKSELERKKTNARSRDVENTDARALSLELLANRMPFNFFTLKQYRDIEDPSRACYQSLVEIERTIEEVLEIREIESPCHVRVHHYPSQPFVEALGLVVKLTREDEGGVIHCLQPIRPFWMKVSLTEKLGRRVTTRAGTEDWMKAELRDPYFLGPRPPSNPAALPTWPLVGRGLVDQLKSEEPVRLRSTAREWLGWVTLFWEIRDVETGLVAGEPIEPKYQPLSVENAKDAVEAIDPQMVIETILSREWENWDTRARWRRSRSEMQRRLDRLLSDATSQEISQREVDFLRTTLANIRQESPRPQIGKDIEESLAILELLGDARHALEGAFGRIGKAATREEFYESVSEFTKEVERFIATKALARDKQSLDWLQTTLRTIKLPNPNATRLRPQAHVWKQIEVAFDAFRRGDESSQLRALVQAIRGIHDSRRTQVIDRLAKSAQKPPFCVPRLCVGPEADRVFPRDQTWDEYWYVGFIDQSDLGVGAGEDILPGGSEEPAGPVSAAGAAVTGSPAALAQAAALASSSMSSVMMAIPAPEPPPQSPSTVDAPPIEASAPALPEATAAETKEPPKDGSPPAAPATPAR